MQEDCTSDAVREDCEKANAPKAAVCGNAIQERTLSKAIVCQGLQKANVAKSGRVWKYCEKVKAATSDRDGG